LDAAEPTIVNAANPLPLPLNPKPKDPLFFLFARMQRYLYSLSALSSTPIPSSTWHTCLITSGGGLVVIVVWSTAPWWMRNTSFGGEDVKMRPALPNEKDTSCAGGGDPGKSAFLLSILEPVAGKASSGLRLIEISAISSGMSLPAFALLFLLNHCMTFRAFVVEAAISEPE
jgi:hypothetical protein